MTLSEPTVSPVRPEVASDLGVRPGLAPEVTEPVVEQLFRVAGKGACISCEGFERLVPLFGVGLGWPHGEHVDVAGGIGVPAGVSQ